MVINKVKNEDENLQLFIYVIFRHEFYTRRKHNRCLLRIYNFSLLKIYIFWEMYIFIELIGKISYFNFFDETGVTQKLYRIFLRLINTLLLYLWEYEYISIVSRYRKCIVIFNNHVSSFIGLLSIPLTQ